MAKGLTDAEGQLRQWSAKQDKTKGEGGKGDDRPGADDKESKKPTWMGRLAGAATLVAGSVAVATAATAALTQAFELLASPITKTAKAARELGADAKGFSSLEYAAKATGGTVEDVAGAVASLQTNLMMADGPAQKLFGQLGLQVERLRELPVDEATAQIAEALNGIRSPAEKARLSLAIFGDKAIQLQPLLSRGAEGIRSLTDEAKRTGVAFDEVGAEKVRMAQEALSRMSASFTGLMNTVAISAAPWIEWGVQVSGAITGKAWSALQSFGLGINQYVTAPVLAMSAPVVDVFTNIGSVISSTTSSWSSTVATAVSSWTDTVMTWAQAVGDTALPLVTSALDGLQPYTDLMSEWFNSAYDTVAGVLARIGDGFTVGLTVAIEGFGYDTKAVFASVQAVVERLIGYISQAAGYVKGLWDYLGKRTSAGDALRGAAEAFSADAEGVGERAGKAIGTGMEAALKQAVKSPLNSVTAKVLQGVTDLENQLRDGIRDIGRTGPEAKINELEAKGADRGQLDRLRTLASQAKDVEAAWGAIEVPPLDMWERQVRGLDAMLESGRISAEQYQRGLAKAGESLQQAAQLGPIKTVGGAMKDSSAAVSAVIKGQLQDKVTNDPAAEMRRAQAELKRINERQLAVGERMLAELKKANEEGEFELV